mmetsp:Transcript_25277/g.37224  ORF Transcript_25277/g.37224 Transcript_25277/m.37224 type:complete len:301 (+) Transcript_25277:982-1884(+)
MRAMCAKAIIRPAPAAWIQRAVTTMPMRFFRPTIARLLSSITTASAFVSKMWTARECVEETCSKTLAGFAVETTVLAQDAAIRLPVTTTKRQRLCHSTLASTLLKTIHAVVLAQRISTAMEYAMAQLFGTPVTFAVVTDRPAKRATVLLGCYSLTASVNAKVGRRKMPVVCAKGTVPPARNATFRRRAITIHHLLSMIVLCVHSRPRRYSIAEGCVHSILTATRFVTAQPRTMGVVSAMATTVRAVAALIPQRATTIAPQFSLTTLGARTPMQTTTAREIVPLKLTAMEFVVVLHRWTTA